MPRSASNKMSGEHKKKRDAGVNGTESGEKKKSDVTVKWSGGVGLRKTASRKCATNYVANARKLKGKRLNS